VCIADDVPSPAAFKYLSSSQHMARFKHESKIHYLWILLSSPLSTQHMMGLNLAFIRRDVSAIQQASFRQEKKLNQEIKLHTKMT
jgi:hypothetical protein